MRFLIVLLLMPAFSYAHTCAKVANSVFSKPPFEEVFERLDNIRRGNAANLTSMKTAAKLSGAMSETGFFKTLPPQVDYAISKALMDPAKLKVNSREIFKGLITSAKNSGLYPKLESFDELAKLFDPDRVVEIPIDYVDADNIASGKKTMTIRKGKAYDFKLGPAVLKINGSGKSINAEITAVSQKDSVMELTAEELTNESPRMASIVVKKNLGAAQIAMLQSLANFYHGFKHTDPLTVIHFRVLD